MLHVNHLYDNIIRRIKVIATDTDMIVLAVATASQLAGIELWLSFGHGDTFWCIGTHIIAAQVGQVSPRSLLFLHAFSGCDTLSSFVGVGTKQPWMCGGFPDSLILCSYP